MENGSTPPRPSLADVATLAGVSRSTASLAFSGLGPVSPATRVRVLDAASTLHYAGPDPRARSLRRGRSGIVGVVIEDRLRDAFRDPVNIAMLDGLSDEIGPSGASILLLTETGELSGGVEFAPVDAVVLIGCGPRVALSVDVLRQRGIPIVAIEAEHREGVVAIDLDNRTATKRLAGMLVELGHSRVAVVTLPLDVGRTRGPVTPEGGSVATSFVATERLAGVKEVFPLADAWATSGSSVEEGTLAAEALLSDPARMPTAIIAQSDLLAVGVVRAALKHGLRVPEDLSVVGFDGVAAADLGTLELSTMKQPAVEKGRAAGRAVLALLAGGEPDGEAFVSEYLPGNTMTRPNENGVNR